MQINQTFDTNFPFHIITGENIEVIIKNHYSDIYGVIEKTYKLHTQQVTVNPNSYFLRFPQKPTARVIALPAYVGGDINVSGIKWIASYPENIQKNFQRASAVIILNDYETGYPFACLEGSLISSFRTANSAVLAAHYISKLSNSSCLQLGIVGNGIIAKTTYAVFKAQGWKFKKIYLFDKNNTESVKFKHTNIDEADRKQTIICNSIEELLSDSSLILLTTTATEPYINKINNLKHNPVILHISLRDLDPEIILNSYNIVDDREHVLSAKTSLDLACQKVGSSQFITATLGELLSGKIPALNNDKPIIFSPMGLGILDLALAKFIFDKAIMLNSTQPVSNFFYNVQR